MANEPDDKAERADSGSRDRATVALVDAKMDGLKDLVRAEFGYIKERIEPIAGIVAEQARIGPKVDDHERRLSSIESTFKNDREFKRDRLPALIIAGVVAIASIIGTVLTQLH